MERKLRLLLGLFVLLAEFLCSWALSSEGLALLCFRERVESDPYEALASWGGSDDPCSWFGVGCSDGKVVSLNLKDLSLKGTLAPELGQLSNMKFLILHNNSLCGPIPYELGHLKQLEVLDAGYNNFSGFLPPELKNIMTLKFLIITNNSYLINERPQIHKSYVYDKERISNVAKDAYLYRMSTLRDMGQMKASTFKRRLMQASAALTNAGPKKSDKNARGPSTSPAPSMAPSPSPSPSTASPPSHLKFKGPTPSPFPSPAGTPQSPSPSPSSSPSIVPAHRGPREVPPPSASTSLPPPHTSNPSHHLYIALGVGASVLLVFVIILIVLCRRNKVVTVRPWATGLSGQLQKAFVTGVPKLKRAELETACEDFSNIIGTLPDSTLYKGTLSSGVEIAVVSFLAINAKEWSKRLEAQFRSKIETLSKVNHKNFVNLLGYCEEEEPFTRMMVFEYAPNGTLFEHLHVRESEQLDWRARLRIAMGMAYCLEHMHQLNPSIAHRSLHSAVVYLTDDFAAKVSDFGFSNAEEAVRMGSGDSGLLATSSTNRENNVYEFGLVILEMLTGKLPHPKDERPLVNWAEDYLRGIQPLRLMIDPILASFSEEEAVALCEVVKSCINPHPGQRPSMKEVVVQLRQITGVTPDGATPRLSPLWWAELEIISAEGS